MSERHTLPLTSGNRQKAHQGVDAAVARAMRGGHPMVLEIREAKRSDEQNRALWGLLRQIVRQRPTHQGVRMTEDTWKAVFMQALGAEMVFMPTLDGDGVFPMGHRSSQLTVGEFRGLIELMLAWCAREGIEVEHFDDGQGSGGANNLAREAA